MGRKMGAPFCSISRWLWTGKNKPEPASNKSSSSDYRRLGVSESDSESGELDWSIGWLESFSPEFQSDDENDGSYAVLVPCYKPGCMVVMDGPKPPLENVIKGLSCDYSAVGKKYMEQWLSSLQGR